MYQKKGKSSSVFRAPTESWWNISEIVALLRLRQEDCELKFGSDYTVSFYVQQNNTPNQKNQTQPTMTKKESK